MIDDPLSLLSLGIWLMAAGMYPLGFLFGACSACCEPICGFVVPYERCMRITRVNNPTPGVRGTHVRVQLRGSGDTGTFQVASSNNLAVADAPTEVVIPIRVSLSASGASRTPVGQSRSQVWRFPWTLPATNFVNATADVVGPPWYLQVDVNVTGTEDTPTTETLFQTDQYGQTKLVLNITQASSTVVVDTDVTLSLTGFQRWQVSGTVVTTGAVSGTLSSGAAVAGWSVNKAEGLSVNSRAFAVQIKGHFDLRGASARHYIFDDVTALDFLNGSHTARVTITEPPGDAGAPFEADYQIFADSVLCGFGIDSLRAGIALGIYPAMIAESEGIRIFTATDQDTGQPRQFSIFGRSCGDKFPLLASDTPTSSGTVFNDEADIVRLNLDAWKNNAARPSLFYDGLSLLWAVENAPWRTTATFAQPNSSTHPVTYHLDPTGSAAGSRTTPTVSSQVVLRVDMQYVGEDPDPNQNRCSPCDITVTDVASIAREHRAFTSGSSTGLFVGDSGSWGFSFSQDGTPLNMFANAYFLQFSSIVPAQYDSDFRFNNALQYLACSGGQVQVTAQRAGGGSLTNAQFRVPSNTLLPFRGTLYYTNVRVEIDTPFTNSSTTRGAGPPDVSCNGWTAVGAAGGVSTNLCGSTTYSAIIEPNPGLLPLFQRRGTAGFGAGFTQPAATCALLGLIALDSSSNSLINNPLIRRISQGDCLLFAPRFTGGTSFLTCSDCHPTLQVLSGGEYATVRIVPDGDRQDAIEFVATTDLPDQQEVQFSVTCGANTITQVIRGTT